MKLKCTTVMEGPGPSEAVVAITTTTGQDELVVDRSLITGGAIEVGRIGQRDDDVLIELPRESASGNWRLWVASASLS